MSEHNRPAQLETLASAAARHGVHPRTIRRRIADGTITGYRSGPRLVRVDRAEVDAALLTPISTSRRGDNRGD
jgi:excisionase family DNA binding protein